MTWQPIETAPKDQWIEMLLWDGNTLGVGFRTDTGWGLLFKLHNWEWGHEISCASVYPTHWMLLPEPPEEEQ